MVNVNVIKLLNTIAGKDFGLILEESFPGDLRIGLGVDLYPGSRNPVEAYPVRVDVKSHSQCSHQFVCWGAPRTVVRIG